MVCQRSDQAETRQAGAIRGNRRFQLLSERNAARSERQLNPARNETAGGNEEWKPLFSTPLSIGSAGASGTTSKSPVESFRCRPKSSGVRTAGKNSKPQPSERSESYESDHYRRQGFKRPTPANGLRASQEIGKRDSGAWQSDRRCACHFSLRSSHMASGSRMQNPLVLP